MSKAQGIVLESGRGWAVIMSEDGRYQKVKSAQPLYAGEYYYGRQRPMLRYGIAAAVLLALLAGTADFFNVVTYASLSPGIELGINRWERVVSVKTEGDQAAQVISHLNISGQPAAAAVGAVVGEMVAREQLAENDSGSLQVTVHSKKNGEKLKEQYKQKLVAKISDSVDQALKVNQKVKIKDEVIEERLHIQYKTTSSNSKGQNQGNSKQKAEQTNSSRSFMREYTEPDNRAWVNNANPRAAVPAWTKGNNDKKDDDKKQFSGNSGKVQKNQQSKANSSKYEKKYKSPWMTNQGKTDWSRLRSGSKQKTSD